MAIITRKDAPVVPSTETKPVLPVIKKASAPLRVESKLAKAVAKAKVAPVRKAVAKKPEVKKPEVKKEKKDTVSSMAARMLITKKFTDAQILSALIEKFGKDNAGRVAATRAGINSGRYFSKQVKELSVKLPLVPIGKEEKKVAPVVKKVAKKK